MGRALVRESTSVKPVTGAWVDLGFDPQCSAAPEIIAVHEHGPCPGQAYPLPPGLSGLLPPPSGLLHHGGGLRRGERIRTGTRNPPPPSGAQPSSFSCADTGIHAPSRRDLAPRRDPPPRHPPISSMPLSPYHACPEPLEGSPPNPGVVRPGSPARFTSKCRKMSQNVALFHTSAPRLRNLRVKNLTFLAKNRPFWPIFVHSRVRKCRTDRPCVASSPGEPGGGLRRGGPSPAETCRKLAAAGVCFNGCRLRPAPDHLSPFPAGRTEKG